MHYLIDGYNLIFSTIESKKSLQTLRNEIIQSLQKEFTRKKLKGTLVFDGAHRKEEESGLSYPNPLIVAYAPKGQSADEYILEKIEFSKNPKQITVVTNDQGLARKAKSINAKVQGNEDFLTLLYKRKKKSQEKEFKDSPAHIERLLRIFEKKFKENL